MCSRCGRGRARGAARSHRGPTSVGLRRGEGGRARGLAAIACREGKRMYYSQSVSLTHLLAWRTGPHAHTRCTRLAREPTRGTLSPAVALGPDCWTHNTQLTGQLTRWRCIVGFSGTDTGEEGGAQGRGHRTHELISQPAPGAVARASAGVFGPAVWQAPGHRPAGRALSRIRDPRRLSEEIRRGADRVLAADHRVHDDVRGEGVQLRHDAVVAQCRIAVCGTPAATRARR